MRTLVVGLPGAGKTYIADRKATEDNCERIRCASSCEKYARVGLYFLQHPFRFMRINLLVVREHRGRLGILMHKFINVVPLAIAVTQKASTFPNAIIDQGMGQLLFSIFDRKISEDTLDVFLQILPPSEYKILYVKADEQVRNTRMKIRHRYPRQGLGDEYVQKWLPMVNANALPIETFFARNYQLEIFDTSND